MLEKVNCIFCGSNRFIAVYSKVDARYFLNANIYVMNQCSACGSYFLSPRVKEEDISEYYPSEFYSELDTSGEIWEKELTKNRKKYGLYLRELKPGKLLDVGCRDGSFVKFLELLDWQAEGFEYSEDIKNRFGCNIFYKDLYQFNENAFDVITLWAVLEHLYHPNDYMEYLHKILKPDGRLIIQVPKFNSFTGKVLLHEDVPRHVSAFTSNGLIKYIVKFGYNLIRINTRCNIFYGSSHGIIRYALLKLQGRNQTEVLRSIYDRRMMKEDVLNAVDLHFSKYLDILLRRFDYWGQMTAVFKKRIEE